MPSIARPGNRLLAALPRKDYKDLSSKLERVPLTFNENIYQPGDIIHQVYFPESGIISLLSAVSEDSTLEVGIVGNEGLAGLPVFLGVKTSANRAVVQGIGSALMIKPADLLDACKNGNALPQLIQRYIHSLLTQISQSAACNRYHLIEDRLARWLLMTHDRMKADEFLITQEFLSNMLGVRREAVNKAARGLQQRELISYLRGKISINNRKGLEKVTCPCYAIIKKEYYNIA